MSINIRNLAEQLVDRFSKENQIYFYIDKSQLDAIGDKLTMTTLCEGSIDIDDIEDMLFEFQKNNKEYYLKVVIKYKSNENINDFVFIKLEDKNMVISYLEIALRAH